MPTERARHAGCGIVWALGLVLAGDAVAQPDGGVDVEIVPPTGLREGDAVRVTARVRLRPAGDVPVLVTPSSEGTAIEVVRGRLLRNDAADPAADPLEFPVPILARSAGTGVLRVHVLSYACAGSRCRAVEGEASVVLRVDRRPE